MWLYGLISVTLLAIAKCSEAEITIEAAFQGKCGHGSPCEQLCYELHDGMYECDCTEGYELQKNGYSCQELNSTFQQEINELNDRQIDDEDILYQKGASFSAKLDDSNIDNIESNLINLQNTNEQSWIIHKFNRKQNKNKIDKMSRDVDDGDEDVDDASDEDDEEEYNVNEYMKSKMKKLPGKQISKLSSPILLSTKSLEQVSSTVSSVNYDVNNIDENSVEDDDDDDDDIMEDEFYSKEEDMSVYDDVNNNKLNLNNLHSKYYNLKPKSRNRMKTRINDMDYQSDQSNSKSYIQIHEYITPSTVIPTKQPMAEITTNIEEITTNVGSSFSRKQGNYSGISNHSGIVIIIMDNATDKSETIASRCSLDCGIDGSCEFNDGTSSGSESSTSRCLCPFGKSGIKCEEDTKINVPRFTKQSWMAFPALRGAYKHVQLHIEFRPESYDGIILLTGERDDLTGDFMALLIHQGFIEFWFDCGSGTGKVQSEETVILNQWNTVTVYRHRWDAWLVLNQGNRVQGRSQGLFSRITFREPVFLGGTGNITGLVKKLPIYDGMIGCIRKFIANEHEYRFHAQPLGDVTQGFDVQECTTDRCSHYPCQHGGKCIPSDQGAICLCPLGFGGDLCEMRLDLQVPSFNGSSYLRFAPLGDSSLIWLELKIIMKPLQEDGLLLYSGHHEYGDYISLCLNMGFVEFTFDLGSGSATVRSDIPLTMGQWHTVRISRTARLAVIRVDQFPEVMTISPNGFWHLSLPHSLFLGGVHNLQVLPISLREKGSFVGCIQRVDVNERPLNIISEALGGSNVDNCPHACIARPCGPLARCIPNLESYECQCNPLNTQCNRAEELLTGATTKLTTILSPIKYPSTITTDISTIDESDDNDDDVEEIENYDEDIDKTTIDSDTTTLTPITTTTIKSKTTKASITKTEFDFDQIKNEKKSMFNKNYNDRLQNQYETDDEYYYEYDEEDDDYNEKANSKMDNEDNNNGHIIINPKSERHHLSLTLLEIVQKATKATSFSPTTSPEKTSPVTTHTTTTPSPTTTESYKTIYSENVKQKLDVTRVNGRYMSVDNDQLLKYDKIKLNKKIKSQKFNSNNQHEQIKYYTEKEFIKKMNKFLKNDKVLSNTNNNYSNLNSNSNKINNNNRKDHGACFTGTDSYLHFSDADTMRRIISYHIDLNLRFKSHSLNGLLLWSGRHTALEDDDYLSLGIENGYLHLRYNLGSGDVNIKYNSTKVSDGLWHRIRAYRNLQEGSLEVDGGSSVVERSPGKLRQLNTDTGLYVGGMSNARYYTRRRYQSGITGCISEIILAGELRLNMDATTIGTAHNVEPGVP